MARTVHQVMLDMLQDLKEITEGKIDLTPYDYHRDEVIYLYPVAGAIASFEAKAENVEDDFHPDTASESGLVKLLRDRQLPDRRNPQKADGKIRFPGEEGAVIDAGFSVKRVLDGKIYICSVGGVVTDGFVILDFKSSSAGQEFNIDSTGEEFSLISPIDGLETTGISVEEFRNGRDLESEGEMLLRIQENDRRTNTGGNLVAYEAWAKEASSQVVTAKAIKNPLGPGTVHTIITSGTTDIDKAVEDGTPVTRIPSEGLIEIVQVFIKDRMPTTDIHITKAPEEEDFDTTILIGVHDEQNRAMVEEKIRKLWKAFVYKVRSGQRVYPSELEKIIDSNLGYLISFRRVQDFTENHYYQNSDTKILNPRNLAFVGV